jgi:hypothetical protein
MLENPIVLTALTCFLLGLVLSGLVRITRSSAVTSLMLPIIFLVSYVLTYQQVPDFPPIGAANKIFYIALAETLVGLRSIFRRGLETTANYSPAIVDRWMDRLWAFCHPRRRVDRDHSRLVARRHCSAVAGSRRFAPASHCSLCASWIKIYSRVSL